MITPSVALRLICLGRNMLGENTIPAASEESKQPKDLDGESKCSTTSIKRGLGAFLNLTLGQIKSAEEANELKETLKTAIETIDGRWAQKWFVFAQTVGKYAISVKWD